MQNITGTDFPIGIVDLHAYVDHIPEKDWQAHDRLGDSVNGVYSNDRYRHVLMMTSENNVYMVIVVRLDADLIKGHHLLDLNDEYAPKKSTTELPPG